MQVFKIVSRVLRLENTENEQIYVALRRSFFISEVPAAIDQDVGQRSEMFTLSPQCKKSFSLDF